MTDIDNTKKKSGVRNLIELNNELKKRLVSAANVIMQKDAEIRTIQRNLRRIGDVSGDKDETIRELTLELDQLKRSVRQGDSTKDDHEEMLKQQTLRYAEENRALTKENKRLLSENSALELEVKTLKEVPPTSENEDLEKALYLATMHNAGLEAQIQEMRAKHPGSTLLRETGETLADGRAKTKLRAIYEHAFGEKGKSIGLEDPMKLLT
jgi:chromosome segregation ATPase